MMHCVNCGGNLFYEALPGSERGLSGGRLSCLLCPYERYLPPDRTEFRRMVAEARWRPGDPVRGRPSAAQAAIIAETEAT